MSTKPITLLFPPRMEALQYSLFPFLYTKKSDLIHFTQNRKWVLEKDKNEILILVGHFKKWKEDLNDEWLERLRNKYRVLVYFDDNDGSEIQILDKLKYFDLYYKKQVFKDKTLYLRSFYGNRIFTQFYREHFHIEEENLRESFPVVTELELTKRIRPFWNISLGQYPLSFIKGRVAQGLFSVFGFNSLKLLQRPFSSRKLPKVSTINQCHARFGFKRYRTSVGFQRKLFLETVQQNPHFLSGLVPKKQYKQELTQIQAVLSPFGWGEVCYRDVEAILNGAVLIKPDMDHLETWPNLYQKGFNYVPLNWDASDLISTVESTLGDLDLMNHLRKNAWETLRQGYEGCGKKAEEILDEILNLK